MGNPNLQFIQKDYDLEDGEYEISFILDGVTYEYEVDAVTGKVTEMDADDQDDPDENK